jgi:hypothetical protein
MKKSELRQIIKEEISKTLSEAQKYDILAVLKSIREFNRGNIDVEELVLSSVKNLGYKPTPENLDNAEDHFIASMDSNDKLPEDKVLVKELYQILK